MTLKENKKLLIEAEKRAEKMSLEDPNFFYYVINKRNKEPKVSKIDWLIMDKINNDGYYPICVYRDGKRI